METIAFNFYSYKEGVGEKTEKSTNLLSKIAWGIFGFSHCKNFIWSKTHSLTELAWTFNSDLVWF